MNLAILRPQPPLDQLVDFFWSSDDYMGTTPRERVLPTGAQALVIHLAPRPMYAYADEQVSEPMAVDAVLCGARSRPLIIGGARGPTVGVQFKPGGARRFFDASAAELAERVISLENLWGREAHLVREQLVEAPSHARLRLLEGVLRTRTQNFELAPSLRASLAAFEEPDLASVAEVNRRTGLSPKRLLSLFHDEVGLSPKRFWRVRRLHAVLRDLDRRAVSGAALAAEHGYCDQAHFLREFRALTGLTPREYLAGRIVGTDHIAVGGKKDPIRRAARGFS